VRSDRTRTIAILPVGVCVFLGVVRREVRAKSGEASSRLQGFRVRSKLFIRARSNGQSTV
jgi:hypothetical protein